MAKSPSALPFEKGTPGDKMTDAPAGRKKKGEDTRNLKIATGQLVFQNKENELNTEKLLHSNAQLEKIKKQLLYSKQELNSFSYSVSHDLSAPLRAILGYSGVLQEDHKKSLNEEGNRFVGVIVNSAQLMSRMIDALLKFSKITTLEITSQTVDMNMLVSSCISEIEKNRKNFLTQVVVQDLPSCRGDSHLLKEVWFNLIDNAVKFSSKNSRARVEIGTQQSENQLVYYVKDNGAGFDMKYYSNLFEAFHRLHTREEYEGVGLGLALVKKLLYKQGGELWGVSSQGEGSVFYFSMPVSKPL